MSLGAILMTLSNEIQKGTAQEHTYRQAPQSPLADVTPRVMASNNPARIKCDTQFIFSRHRIDVDYVEAKDIADDLDETEKSESLNAAMISLRLFEGRQLSRSKS